MKKKRSTILLLLASIIVFPLFTGCFGVGEDDPFISLRSRKARLTGDWDISSYYKNVKQINDTVARFRVITEVSGDDYDKTIQYLGTDSVAEIEGIVLNAEMTFDKNGNFTYAFEYQTEEKKQNSETFSTTTITATHKNTMNGTWNFLAGIDDYSNKERLSLVVLNEQNSVVTVTEIKDEETGNSTSETSRDYLIQQYANGEISYIWEIDMLKNKEVNLYQNINNVAVSADSSGQAFDEIGYQRQVLKSQGDE